MKKKFGILCGVLFVGLCAASPVWGERAKIGWIGGNNGDWNESSNWYGGEVPGDGSHAQIDTGSVNVVGLSGSYTDLEISVSNNNSITLDGDIVFGGDCLVKGYNNGKFESSYMVQLRDRAFIDLDKATFNVNNLKITGGKLRGNFSTINISTLEIGSDSDSGTSLMQVLTGDFVKVDHLSIKSETATLELINNIGPEKDENGNLLGGITISPSGTVDLSKGTVKLTSGSPAFIHSETVYTLIENGVKELPANFSSNLFYAGISNGNLTAKIKEDLPTEGVYGAVKLTEDSLTLYSNLEGDAFDTFWSTFNDPSVPFNVQKGSSPFSIVISKNSLSATNTDIFIWDFTYWNDMVNSSGWEEYYGSPFDAQLSPIPYASNIPVPEPATWWMLLLGSVLVLKRRVLRKRRVVG
ncbi:MAG: PEP-CTERM sorting domain-containing protein [Planctomycetia bacterium]|nr:PEP-CTERM sorting domain-containing protein [Planctomycetia bacterium]